MPVSFRSLLQTFLILILSYSVLASNNLNAESWQEFVSRSDSLFKEKNVDGAISELNRALTVIEPNGDTADSLRTTTYLRLGSIKLMSGRFDLARQDLEIALDVGRKRFQGSNAITASILHNLGNAHWRLGLFEQSESTLVEALSMRVEVLGSEHTDVAKTLGSLGTIRKELGKYQEAEEHFLSAMAIFKKTLGAASDELALTLNNLANLYKTVGRLGDAEHAMSESLRMRIQLRGDSHPTVAQSAVGLANIYRIKGDYNEAESLFVFALKVFEKTKSATDPEVLRTVGNFADLKRMQGKYAEAEKLSRRAIDGTEITLGQNDPSLGTLYSGLAGILEEQRRLDEALVHQTKALDLQKRTYGNEHPLIAKSMVDLGNLHRGLHQDQIAESLYTSALDLYQSTIGSESPEVALTEFNIGILHRDRREFDSAEDRITSALLIWRKTLGNHNPEVANCLLALGTIAVGKAKFQEADTLLQNALDEYLKLLGPDHYEVAAILIEMSNLRALTKEYSGSLDYAQQALENRIYNFESNATVLSERDAVSYSRWIHWARDEFLSAYFLAGSPENTNAAEYILQTKGLASSEAYRLQKFLLRSLDTASSACYRELKRAKAALSQEYAGSFDSLEAQERSQKIDSLRTDVNELESKLARLSSDYTNELNFQDVSIARIKPLLSSQSTLVEYLRWDSRGFKDGPVVPHFAVSVMNSDGLISVKDLGESRFIDTLIAEYRSHIAGLSINGALPLEADLTQFKSIANKLYGSIFRPIRESLTGADLLIIAPDAGLSLIPFASLVDDSGRYLVESHPIHYLSAGRDMIRLLELSNPSTGLLALGDPDFNATASQRLTLPDDLQHSTPGVRPSTLMYNQRSACEELNRLRVDPLPATRLEVTSIADSWKSTTGQQSVFYVGPSASENRFKEECSGKQVIHLATHGFFLGGECSPKNQTRGFHDESDFVGENPLLLSGLLLAGANLHGQGADSLGIDDGILTAEEVGGLNLEGTKLVVLSACETGLGKVEQGEGVYGLRRAFQMAGARTVVSALWKVDDKTTADMMKELYRQSDEPIPVRMRKMQLAQIKKLRAEGLSDHPFWWGAFIAMGDWR